MMTFEKKPKKIRGDWIGTLGIWFGLGIAIIYTVILAAAILCVPALIITLIYLLLKNFG